MSWLSKATGINIHINRIAPGVDALAVRKGLETLQLDAATLRVVARVAAEMASEKEKI